MKNAVSYSRYDQAFSPGSGEKRKREETAKKEQETDATSRDATIANFQEVTGIDDVDRSIEFLESTNWNVQSAASLFFAQQDPSNAQSAGAGGADGKAKKTKSSGWGLDDGEDGNVHSFAQEKDWTGNFIVLGTTGSGKTTLIRCTRTGFGFLALVLLLDGCFAGCSFAMIDLTNS